MLSILPGKMPRRYSVVLLSFLSIFVCYIDRVNISVAVIPMAEDLGWSMETQGTVLSSFFVGYLLLQVVGGRLADRFGGKVILGGGVLRWYRRNLFYNIPDAITVTTIRGPVHRKVFAFMQYLGDTCGYRF